MMDFASIPLPGFGGAIALDHSVSCARRKDEDFLNDVVTAHPSTNVQRISKVVGVLVA